MITEDAILNFIPTQVLGTGFSRADNLYPPWVSIYVLVPVPVPVPFPVPDSGFSIRPK